MNLVTPAFGLIFWSTITFAVVLFVLSRYAWKPIMQALKDREKSIEDALQQAEIARQQIEQVKSDNEKLLDEARIERDKILKAANKAADQTREDAKAKASAEVERMIADARKAIDNEKQAAIAELKNQVAVLSVDIAEKLLRKQLSNPDEQKQIVTEMIDKMDLN